MLPWYLRIYNRVKWQFFDKFVPIAGGFLLAQAVVSTVVMGPSFLGLK